MAALLSAQEFVNKWRRVSLKERSACQSHFNDLCRLVGESTPVEADPQGTWYTFEAGAAKSGGGDGFADVWKKGYFAWEYKGKHANLVKAYEQLQLYRESLENPPLLIVSDMDSIVIHTNFTNTVKRVETITLDDLLKPDRLDLLRCVFVAPDRFRSTQTTAQVTQQAATRFAELASLLRAYGAEPQEIAHFLIRLLFCLFAEDVRILPENVFTHLVTNTRKNPQAFQAGLSTLFRAMSTGGMFGFQLIPHFDGGLFEDDRALPLDSDGMTILAEVCALDWANIEPSILGTLFERSLDPSKRSQLGAHYTSRDDILLIVEPVLMAPLRRRWAEVEQQAREQAAKRDAAKTRSARTTLENNLRKLLEDFTHELAQVQILDPACGSGNFLYVALRQLLDLWKQVSVLGAELGFPLMAVLEGFAPHPSQLHGVELNPYAHELAQTTIWIGFLQWLHENGYGTPAEPILKPLQAVLQMDAVLAYDSDGKPTEPVWPEADIIIGNPPFLGGSKLRRELGDKYVESLFGIYEGRVPHGADLVCYWFERARAMIAEGTTKRAGLLATNSIRDGSSRRVLERIKQSGDIFMAWSDRDWILEGAAVNVSMVGFDNGLESAKMLDGRPVNKVNADLTSSVDLTVAKSLPENASICFRSDEKGGPFDIDAVTARGMLDAPLNPNGRANADVVRPYLNAFDMLRRPQDRWIIDFGCEMSEEDAAQYELPFEYVLQVVKPVREQVRNERERTYWWLHRRPAPDMRKAVSKLRRFIITPEVSKHRIFAWLGTTSIPDHRLHVIAREDDYFLGVLHSRLHELWALSMGSTLEDRPCYRPTTCFETYPFPWPPDQEPQGDPRVEAIAQAARELVQKRDAWLHPEGATEKQLATRTLTNLYNKRPTWLEFAHQKLDAAVLDAYGWPHDLSDEEILERLLALNLERANKA